MKENEGKVKKGEEKEREGIWWKMMENEGNGRKG